MDDNLDNLIQLLNTQHLDKQDNKQKKKENTQTDKI